MEYIVGITLAVLFCGAAAGLGMGRERAFYPAVTIAVASYYLAFAVADGRSEVMLSEAVIAAVFIFAAVAGFKRSPWFAVVALGGHGVMDAFHHHFVHNTGVPPVWPGFCMSFDVTAAALVAAIMVVRADRKRKLQDLGTDGPRHLEIAGAALLTPESLARVAWSPRQGGGAGHASPQEREATPMDAPSDRGLSIREHANDTNETAMSRLLQWSTI